MLPEVGDAVQYVPHECHAMERDIHGDYAWVFGFRRHDGAEVKELDAKETEQHLDYVRRAPDPGQVRKQLVLLRPRKPWPAKVRAVDDVRGTVDLDIQAARSGVTLHYDGVPFAQIDKKPHTCHRKDGV